MRLGKCSVKNFGSYASLDFDYSNLGLTLIYGPTGAGKSTLLDIPSWILYGKTTKEVSADQVKSWNHPGITEGTIEIFTSNGHILVSRTRGPNDLSWREAAGHETRGKDLNDTQALLNKRLGLNYEGFIASSCYHENSASATFFQAKAKDRREFFEQMANLELPRRVGDGASENIKGRKKEIEEAEGSLAVASGALSRSEAHYRALRLSADEWARADIILRMSSEKEAEDFQAKKAKTVQDLTFKSNEWESKKQEYLNRFSDLVMDLSDKFTALGDLDIRQQELEQRQEHCQECGQTSPKYSALFAEVMAQKHEKDRLGDKIDAHLTSIRYKQQERNPFTGSLVAAEASVYVPSTPHTVNPFTDRLKDLETYIAASHNDLSALKEQLLALSASVSSLNQVQDAAQTLRMLLLHNAISEMEQETNCLLSRHFDSEFRVQFTMVSADDLDVSITKDGADCAYRQLSKGQQQILRLCFTLATMKVSSARTGISHDAIFLDEALHGLDGALKTKTLSLFLELAANHTSVLLVEHDLGVQSMCDSRIKVSLASGNSELEYE